MVEQRTPSPGPPEELCCPISGELYDDPVLLVESGQTYSRKSIEEWFGKGHRSCPLTGKELISLNIAPNYTVKGLVQTWLEKNGVHTANHAQHERSTAFDLAKYPPVFNGQPQDRVAQAAELLEHLRSPRMEVAAYRKGCSYELSLLYTLAKDKACHGYLLREGAVGTAAQLLADENLAESSSSLLRCLATPEGSKVLSQAGKLTCGLTPHTAIFFGMHAMPMQTLIIF